MNPADLTPAGHPQDISERRIVVGFGNMGKMMQQIQKMQQEMDQLQNTLDQKTVEAQSGGGVVRVVCNGALEIVELEIEPDVVDPDDVDMLRDLVIAAVNQGLRAARDMVGEEMSKITGGLNLPNIPGLTS